MTIRFSTGLRNSVLGNARLSGTSLAYSDNGGSPDTITDSENRFLTAGFKVGDAITTTGSSTASNDVSSIVLTVVAAGTLTFVTGTLAASEAFLATTVLTGNNGGSVKDLFTDGVLEIYSGSQPASADDAENGTMLVRITLSSGAFTPGSATNGLEFGQEISGTLAKRTDETWSGVASNTGTASWFRFYDNNYDTGADTSAVRFDGSVGVGSGDLNMASTSISSGSTITIDEFNIALPASA